MCSCDETKIQEDFEQKSGMCHKILSSTRITRDRMIEFLKVIYGAFTQITQDRKKIIKTYFDFRTHCWNVDPEGEDTRSRLIEDPLELIEDIDKGHTVVFVFLD